MRRQREGSTDVFVIGGERMLDEAELGLDGFADRQCAAEEAVGPKAGLEQIGRAFDVGTAPVTELSDVDGEPPTLVRGEEDEEAPRARSMRLRLAAIGAVVAMVGVVVNLVAGRSEEEQSSAGEELAARQDSGANAMPAARRPAPRPERADQHGAASKAERPSRDPKSADREDHDPEGADDDPGSAPAPAVSGSTAVGVAGAPAPVASVAPTAPAPSPTTSSDGPVAAASAAEVRQEFGP
jgi:hypothetical protein